MPTETAVVENGTIIAYRSGTARMVIVGGTSLFKEQFKAWLIINRHTSVEPRMTAEANVVIVEEPVDTLRDLTRLFQDGCGPDDLYKAIVPPLIIDEYLDTVVMGKNAAAIDRRWNNIAEPNRCLGTPPALLAEKGW